MTFVARWGTACVLALTGCSDDAGGTADPDDGAATEAIGSTTDAMSADATTPGSTTSDPGTTAPASTTGVDSTGDDSTGEPPVVGTPVFVALGDGGWTATSCDGGQSWTQHAFDAEQGDHTPWTAFGGIAFGAESFVAGFGWGAPGHILRSTDGLDWQELGDDAFLVDGAPTPYDSWTAGVAYTGTQFIAFASTIWGSPDGVTWMPSAAQLPPGSDQLRQLRGFPSAGVLVASLESQSGNGHAMGNFVVVSDDDGLTWTEGTGYDPDCSSPIQHLGDIELRGDTLLVATRDVCRSTDLGQTWQVVTDPTGSEIYDLFVDATGFGAVAGSRVYHSDDGETWAQVADVGTDLRAAAWAAGASAAVSRNGAEFFWSADGVTWQPATLDWTPAADINVRDFAVGVLPGGCGA
jgi:hypothetical protein